MNDSSRTDNSLTKSDLIDSLARNQNHLAQKDVELAVKSLLEKMSQELANGDRIEIRGFGSFSLHFRGARMGRNPKSCLLYTSPSPRDLSTSRMPSSA